MIYKESCEHIGMTSAEIAELKLIAAGLNRLAKRAEKLGITIFGGSSGGDLRKGDGSGGRRVILSELSCPSTWDGGCGACWEDENGILRGE